MNVEVLVGFVVLSLSLQLKRGKWTLRMMAAGCDTGGNRPVSLEAKGGGLRAGREREKGKWRGE